MTTPHLQLPEVPQAILDASDEINAGFRQLDAIVQLAVIDKDETAPPLTAVQGDRYIVPTSGATGVWTGWGRSIALRLASSWQRIVPRPGWRARVLDESKWYLYTGTAWEEEIISSGGDGAFDPASMVDMFQECLSLPGTSAFTAEWQQSAGGGAISQAGVYQHPGVWRLSTGGSSSSGNAYILHSANISAGAGIVLGVDAVNAEFLVRFPTLPTGTQTWQFIAGLFDAQATSTNRVAASLLWNGSSARWAVTTRQSGNTTTANGASTVVADTWYLVRVEASATAVNVYINDVLEVTTSSNIPTAGMALGAIIVKTAGTGTAGTADIDFIRLRQTLTSSRY